ncbi:MAG: heparinase II/III family protein [Clostridia bacterium]|nr:heparinase II/III family protein [Clostridia bacterium]
MNLLGKMQDKEFWAYVRDAECYKPLVEKLKNEYTKNMEKGDLKCLKYSEFKLYWTTGERYKYEGSLNHIGGRMMASAILSLIYPEEQEYLDTLMDSLFAICDEYSWCLPAHHGALSKPDSARVDLNAATTAASLAEVYTLLGDRLEPLIKNRIVAELDRRVINTFYPATNYWWELRSYNWTAVCTGGVARAIMLVRPELMTEEFIQRTVTSMECYLKGFDSMGICYEGNGYWSYGFGYFVLYADMIRRFTEGRVDFFKREKVKKIACYYQKMFLSGDKGVSFADSQAELRYPIHLMHFLKNEYPDDVLVYDFKYSTWPACNIRSFGWFDENIMKNPANDEVSFEMYSPEAQWLVKRTSSYGFAAKGGDNEEFHNHNDVGSFIFAKDGEHVFTDPGAALYVKGYFVNSERYKFLESSSRSHSVPIINGVLQSFGKEFKAKGARYENGTFSLDIAGAYECEGLNSIIREFVLKESEVIVTDTFDYSGEGKIVDRIVTRFEPKALSEGELEVGKGSISFDPSLCELAVSSVQDSKNKTVWFIDFTLKQGVNKITYLMK